jgi:hypothetical protein
MAGRTASAGFPTGKEGMDMTSASGHCRSSQPASRAASPRESGSSRPLRVAGVVVIGILLGLPVLLAGCGSDDGNVAAYPSGNLIVSRTVYAGTAATVSVGQELPGGGLAIANGTFPDVFKNEIPDPSFGVTSPIFLDQRTPAGALVGTQAIDPALITTSFASKADLGLSIATDRSAVSFMGYKAAVNQLDVAASNTAAMVDPTNPVKSVYPRAVALVQLGSGEVKVIAVNAYSGNNGRGAILANGTFYMAGNAGNGSGDGFILSALSDNTGVQAISAGSPGTGTTTVIGEPLGTYGAPVGYQRGFSLAQVPNPARPGEFYAADKTGKDCNFRGLAIFGDTLYVSKGSGSNGVNTVYQVGPAGALANGANLGSAVRITILPGFNAISQKVAETPATFTPTPHPFGLWFGDAATLFVADEGDGIRPGGAGKVTTFAGLGMYKLASGTWTRVATFQAGLLDQPAYKAGLPWNIKADGLRNLAGKANGDGTFTVYATTSTVSDETSHDSGADPNQLVTITIGPSSTPANAAFTVLQTASAGERLGGVAVVP